MLIHAVRFDRGKADLFLESVYNISLVLDRKYCEMASGFLQNALLKSILGHEFLIVALHLVLAIGHMPKSTPADIDV